MEINWKVVLVLGLAVWSLIWSQTSLITIVVVFVALFYISYVNRHLWISRFHPADEDTKPDDVVGGMDSQGRSYLSHDYRADKK